MATNSTNAALAETLAKARHGTFTGLIIKQKGEEKGKGADRKVYGDDEVHVVIVTGFRYGRLVERSLAVLGTVSDADIVAEATAKGLTDAKTGAAVTIRDVIEARVELTRSLAESVAGLNEGTSDHVYDPLVVDGENVAGCRLYKCVAGSGTKCHCQTCNPTNPRAPIPGSINLSGLMIGRKVLTPAANGPVPPAASSAKTHAKNLLRKRLPISRYVSYTLPPKGDYLLRAGGAAAVLADQNGVTVAAEVLDEVA